MFEIWSENLGSVPTDEFRKRNHEFNDKSAKKLIEQTKIVDICSDRIYFCSVFPQKSNKQKQFLIENFGWEMRMF